MSGRRWLLVAAMLGAACARAQDPPPAPPLPREQPASPAQRPPGPHAADPDEGLLEFLGSDDVGDTAWWEFLKKSPPKAPTTAAPPDGKQ